MPNPKAPSIPSLTQKWAIQRKLPYLFFEETQSTNEEAKKRVFLQPLLLLIARKQTKGRGQNQNRWENSDLMLSWLLQKNKTFSPLLCQELAFDLFSNAKKIWPKLKWSVKKPNDLLLEQKKVAGLLLEVIDETPRKALVLGLGFNVFSHPKQFPATHLMEHTSNFSPSLWEKFLDLNHQTFTRRILK